MDQGEPTNKDHVIEILESCGEQLPKDLTRNAGSTLTHLVIEDVPSAIKRLAVREEKITVARVTMRAMQQDHEDSVDRSMCLVHHREFRLQRRCDLY